MGLDIIEHLMKTVYVVMPKADEMRRAHDRREKAKARARARRGAK